MSDFLDSLFCDVEYILHYSDDHVKTLPLITGRFFSQSLVNMSSNGVEKELKMSWRRLLAVRYFCN